MSSTSSKSAHRGVEAAETRADRCRRRSRAVEPPSPGCADGPEQKRRKGAKKTKAAPKAYPITERDRPITDRLQINVPTSAYTDRSPTELPARFYRGIVVERCADAPTKYAVIWLSNERNPDPEAIPEKTLFSKADIIKYMTDNPVTTYYTQERWTAWLNNPFSRR